MPGEWAGVGRSGPRVGRRNGEEKKRSWADLAGFGLKAGSNIEMCFYSTTYFPN
jgi:hypothetical protein